MTVLHLAARTDKGFPLDAPPEVAFRHFVGNEELLARFLGREHVERLPDGCFRIQLARHGALGLVLQPCFDVAFTERPPDRVEMRSVRVALVQSSHADAELAASFTGSIVFVAGEGDRATTQATCWARMAVDLTLPAALAWLPAPPLEALGNGIMGTAMAALAGRLVPILQAEVAAVGREATRG